MYGNAVPPPSDFETNVLRRLSNLETHIINTIVPLQKVANAVGDRNILNDLIHLTNSPLKIDNRDLKCLLDDFRKSMNEFRKDLEKVEILLNLAEIKFIGQKIAEIFQEINKIAENGITKEVKLDLFCDGYRLIKDEEKIAMLPKKKEKKDILDEIIKSFSNKNISLTFQYYFGLIRVAPIKKPKELALLIGVTPGTIRTYLGRMKRMFRQPVRNALVKEYGDKEIMKWLMEE
jgi:hypothetical protein